MKRSAWESFSVLDQTESREARCASRLFFACVTAVEKYRRGVLPAGFQRTSESGDAVEGKGNLRSEVVLEAKIKTLYPHA